MHEDKDPTKEMSYIMWSGKHLVVDGHKTLEIPRLKFMVFIEELEKNVYLKPIWKLEFQ